MRERARIGENLERDGGMDEGKEGRRGREGVRVRERADEREGG